MTVRNRKEAGLPEKGEGARQYSPDSGLEQLLSLVVYGLIQFPNCSIYRDCYKHGIQPVLF